MVAAGTLSVSLHDLEVVHQLLSLAPIRTDMEYCICPNKHTYMGEVQNFPNPELLKFKF